MSVQCQVCSQQFNKITPRHIKIHGITVEQYRNQYPDSPFVALDIQAYISKANKIHNNKYDYSLVAAHKTKDIVTIICPTHGEFRQQLASHIDSRQGCAKCSHNYPLTLEEFVQRSQAAHGDKFTIIPPFNGIKHPIKIACKNHGIFVCAKAETHPHGGGGCPECLIEGRRHRMLNRRPAKMTKVSKSEKEWLDSLGVPLRQHKLEVNGRSIYVDGFDPSTNTVYECHGSYWHGNPDKFDPTVMNVRAGKTFGELYQATLLREQAIRKHHNLVTKWT